MVALPLSVFALNLVIALGLGLSVDFSLLIVSRFREEYGRQGSIDAALAHRAADRRPDRALQLPHHRGRHGHARYLPRALRLLHGNRRCGRRPVRRRLRPVRPALASDDLRGAHCGTPARRAGTVKTAWTGDRRWYRIATVVMRRPALWALSALLVLLVLAAPFLHVSFTGADASSSAGKQLGRNRLRAGPDQVRRLLRGARGPCRRCGQGDARGPGDGGHRSDPRRESRPSRRSSTWEAPCGSPTWHCPLLRSHRRRSER